MHSNVFSFRKENVSLADAREYGRCLREDLLGAMGFDSERCQISVLENGIITLRDAGGAEIDYSPFYVPVTDKQPGSIHVNLFEVRSHLPEQIKDLKNQIAGYSQQLGYFGRDGLADSLSLR